MELRTGSVYTKQERGSRRRKAKRLIENVRASHGKYRRIELNWKRGPA